MILYFLIFSYKKLERSDLRSVGNSLEKHVKKKKKTTNHNDGWVLLRLLQNPSKNNTFANSNSQNFPTTQKKLFHLIWLKSTIFLPPKVMEGALPLEKKEETKLFYE